jgi:anaerobic selenocysteine-containing dehydrogenase
VFYLRPGPLHPDRLDPASRGAGCGISLCPQHRPPAGPVPQSDPNRRCLGLNDILGEETADISPVDAARLDIKHDERIKVTSRRGEVQVKAKVTKEVPQGMVWMAFHFREACANWLTNPVFDPVSQTAEYKACAVQIEKI